MQVDFRLMETLDTRTSSSYRYRISCSNKSAKTPKVTVSPSFNEMLNSCLKTLVQSEGNLTDVEDIITSSVGIMNPIAEPVNPQHKLIHVSWFNKLLGQFL